jgi:hypothetical protein
MPSIRRTIKNAVISNEFESLTDHLFSFHYYNSNDDHQSNNIPPTGRLGWVCLIAVVMLPFLCWKGHVVVTDLKLEVKFSFVIVPATEANDVSLTLLPPGLYACVVPQSL